MAKIAIKSEKIKIFTVSIYYAINWKKVNSINKILTG